MIVFLRIRLINHPVNRGYGAALVTGFESVTKDLVFFMDSDGQFDIRDLASFLPLIEEYGAVLGCKCLDSMGDFYTIIRTECRFTYSLPFSARMASQGKRTIVFQK